MRFKEPRLTTLITLPQAPNAGWLPSHTPRGPYATEVLQIVSDTVRETLSAFLDNPQYIVPVVIGHSPSIVEHLASRLAWLPKLTPQFRLAADSAVLNGCSTTPSELDIRGVRASRLLLVHDATIVALSPSDRRARLRESTIKCLCADLLQGYVLEKVSYDERSYTSLRAHLAVHLTDAIATAAGATYSDTFTGAQQ
jgi:hypothetical protein